jgi:outer membrane autotransporter protein
MSGDGLGLSYGQATASDVRAELGTRLDETLNVGTMLLIIRSRLAYAHDRTSNTSLPGSNFVVNGAPIPQNSALASTSVELLVTQQLMLLLKFDGEFASGSLTYGGSGTLRYTW